MLAHALLGLFSLCCHCGHCILHVLDVLCAQSHLIPAGQLLISWYQDQDISIECVGAEKHLKHAWAGCPQQVCLNGDKSAKHMTPNRSRETVTELHKFKSTCFLL